VNITEKIMAKAAGLDEVKPDQIISVKVDRAFTHEKLGPMFFNKFRKKGLKVWDNNKATVFVDHGVPPSKVMDAELIIECEEFAREHNLECLNGQGICHQVNPEKGYVLPGRVVLGTDSHTCTYGALGAFATGIGSTEMAYVFNKGSIWMKVPRALLFEVTGELGPLVMGKDLILYVISMIGVEGANYRTMEFRGEAISKMSLDSRMAACNMAVEAGAKNGIIEADEKVVEFLKGRTTEKFDIVKSDADAVYEKVYQIDGSKLEPMVACPDSAENSVPVTQVVGTPFNRALLGTCTGGRMEDFRIAAQIIRGKKVHPTVRLQVVPASQEIFKRCIEEGIVQTFIDAGAIWCNPNCGPCGGGHLGVLGKNEVCVSTSNRNMKGRMGDPASKIYLASPATVAASAVTGVITDPRELLGGASL